VYANERIRARREQFEGAEKQLPYLFCNFLARPIGRLSIPHDVALAITGNELATVQQCLLHVLAFLLLTLPVDEGMKDFDASSNDDTR